MTAALALDTSGRGAQIAVARDGDLLAQVRHDPNDGYAESLFPLVDRALSEASLDWGAVARIAAIEGPGSFTGLRIGIMTAKSLAFGRNLELWGARIPELAAAHGRRDENDGPVAVIQEAGRGAVTASVHHAGETAPAEPVRIEISRVDAWLEALAPGPRSIVTVGDIPLADAVAAEDLAADLARATSCGAWPARRVEPVTFVPYYVAPSQAERARGLDLRDEVHRVVPPRSWPR